MKLYIEDEIQRRCNLSSCRSKRSIRKGSWFQSSKLNFLKCVRFIYCWSEELNSVKLFEKQLEISHGTTVDWNNFMSEICVNTLLKREKWKIVVLGMIVEMDKNLFTKRKNNAERILPLKWTFGGVCRRTNVFLWTCQTDPRTLYWRQLRKISKKKL